ncbi:MAG: histidine--tRNA ligase, partial [Nanoarchaeota archaeon]
MKETFKLTDQGGRKLALRFDLTVPLARYVAMNPFLKMPFKRYQMEKVYRDGPIKLGRYREFWQCDVDIVGSSSMLAEAEVFDLVFTVFKELGLNIVIEFNNRKVLDGVLEFAGVPENKRNEAMIVIDKFKKLSKAELEEEFTKAGIAEDVFVKIMGLLESAGRSNQGILENLSRFVTSEKGREGIAELNELLSYLKALGIDEKKCRLNPSLARGLSYYTGPVFEGFLENAEEAGITSSLCGGGRYDDMIGKYIGEDKVIPATGISFGLEPITEVLKLELKELKKTMTRVYVIPINTISESLKIVKIIRENNVNAEIDISGKGISKNLDYANSLGIPYVIFIGQDELAQSKIKLRNMETGKESMLTVGECVQALKEGK